MIDPASCENPAPPPCQPGLPAGSAVNPALLDREQLENIVLGLSSRTEDRLSCSDAVAHAYPADAKCPRARRLRRVLAAAHELLVRSAAGMAAGRSLLDQPSLACEYLKLHFAGAEVESFVVVFLDAGLRVITVEELFRGTLTRTEVHPREVVRRALHHNAAHLLVSHCHPSGEPEPSRADQILTQVLKSALALVDVTLIDHIVVAGGKTLSMTERKLM